ncbi:DnaD domain protein [Cytobacillus praedii]|uniref:DnaD domain protein n=1 Tax=Cytobacillus praedii TaxID=1742358 RepID=UPI002E1B3C6E|nr:DnaD domain protein [Cytobacillus praedii]
MKKNKRVKKINSKIIHDLTAQEGFKEVHEMTIDEWNAKLEERNKAKTGKMIDRKRRKKVQGKVVHRTTPEEKFYKKHGMTMEEWQREQQFKVKSGLEWFINQVNSQTPIEFLKEPNGTVTEEDIKLVKDLHLMGLKDEVINVLLHYALVVSRIGLVHPLVKEMGKSWYKNNLLTVENAIVFVREEQKKYNESSET